jgi:peptidoglycan/xylan/chitin deacetylase (PgdA/CDA1 family)
VSAVCLTVDVEDFYEGMHTLGHDLAPPARPEPGLGALRRLLDRHDARITLFVVGRHAEKYADALRALAADGHEIASHGPDHGRLPGAGAQLTTWLRSGRTMLEDVVQRRVTGFRSPRFDLPVGVDVERFRDAIEAAGFAYVSDTRRSVKSRTLAELPVSFLGPLPLGGGSYQRLVPAAATAAFVRRRGGPTVLYYHSYDFGRELPPLRSARSPAVVAQLLARPRIADVFGRVLTEFGSQTCTEVIDALR